VKVVELASDRVQAAPKVFPQLSVALKESGVLVAEGEVSGCWPGQGDEAGDGVQVDEVLTGVDHPSNASHFSWAVGPQGDKQFPLEREGCFEEGFAAGGWEALVMAGAADRGIEATRPAFDDGAALVGVEVFVLDSGDEGDALGLQAGMSTFEAVMAEQTAVGGAGEDRREPPEAFPAASVGAERIL
jgi:hypothetical protein